MSDRPREAERRATMPASSSLDFDVTRATAEVAGPRRSSSLDTYLDANRLRENALTFLKDRQRRMGNWYNQYGVAAINVGKAFARLEGSFIRNGRDPDNANYRNDERDAQNLLEAFTNDEHRLHGMEIKTHNYDIGRFQERYGSNAALMRFAHHIRLMNEAYTTTYFEEVRRIPRGNRPCHPLFIEAREDGSVIDIDPSRPTDQTDQTDHL
jgi:hypothetical protein